tara:strand:+ start:566 stop:982 length:417 start_codon:yes stop_codon:yes gene_type:complete
LTKSDGETDYFYFLVKGKRERGKRTLKFSKPKENVLLEIGISRDHDYKLSVLQSETSKKSFVIRVWQGAVEIYFPTVLSDLEEDMKQVYADRLFFYKYDLIMDWLDQFRDLSPKKGSEIFKDLRISAETFGKHLGVIE